MYARVFSFQSSPERRKAIAEKRAPRRLGQEEKELIEGMTQAAKKGPGELAQFMGELYFDRYSFPIYAGMRSQTHPLFVSHLCRDAFANAPGCSANGLRSVSLPTAEGLLSRIGRPAHADSERVAHRFGSPPSVARASGDVVQSVAVKVAYHDIAPLHVARPGSPSFVNEARSV